MLVLRAKSVLICVCLPPVGPLRHLHAIAVFCCSVLVPLRPMRFPLAILPLAAACDGGFVLLAVCCCILRRVFPPKTRSAIKIRLCGVKFGCKIHFPFILYVFSRFSISDAYFDFWHDFDWVLTGFQLGSDWVPRFSDWVPIGFWLGSNSVPKRVFTLRLGSDWVPIGCWLGSTLFGWVPGFLPHSFEFCNRIIRRRILFWSPIWFMTEKHETEGNKIPPTKTNPS